MRNQVKVEGRGGEEERREQCDRDGGKGGRESEEAVTEEMAEVTAGYCSSPLTDLMSRLHGCSSLTGDN